jgi:hypothetical protein
MAPPQIPNGFRFRPNFPIFSPLQNEASPSSVPNFKPFAPILVSLNNDKGKNVVDDVVG